MRFSDYSFGSVRVDGVTYDHDLIIDREEIRKRAKGARASGPVTMLEGSSPRWQASRGSRRSGIGSVVVGHGEDRAIAQGAAGDGSGVALAGA